MRKPAWLDKCLCYCHCVAQGGRRCCRLLTSSTDWQQDSASYCRFCFHMLSSRSEFALYGLIKPNICRLVQGPVSAFTTVEGSLLAASGRRVDQYAWTGTKLLRIAFHDTALEVTCLASIKSFLLYGDALKGLHFLQAAPGSRQLTQISKAGSSPYCTPPSRIYVATCSMVRYWPYNRCCADEMSNASHECLCTI